MQKMAKNLLEMMLNIAATSVKKNNNMIGTREPPSCLHTTLAPGTAKRRLGLVEGLKLAFNAHIVSSISQSLQAVD
jgi:hypothetical protein